MCLLISSYNTISLYLAIEGLSFCLYILATYPGNIRALEAATKYYTMGGISSAFLLLGILILYGSSGEFSFIKLKEIIDNDTANLFSDFDLDRDTRLLGTYFIVCGFLFKLGVYPFHN
jgi:NADH-quinone oxidoreductase subunit N